MPHKTNIYFNSPHWAACKADIESMGKDRHAYDEHGRYELCGEIIKSLLKEYKRSSAQTKARIKRSLAHWCGVFDVDHQGILEHYLRGNRAVDRLTA